jgi:phosphoribosylamine--glycine ligase
LLVGSGAREHAIAAALVKTGQVELYAAMSSRNPGIIKLSKDTRVTQISNPQTVADYAKRMGIELALVGPEAPLVSGVVDALRALGVRCVGPTQRLASLEGDKGFCRELLSKYGIPGNPFFRVFTRMEEAETFLRTARPVAIKPAGLTGGKGVKVTGEDLPSKEAELEYAREIFQNKVGGGKLIVEEFLDGEEFSLQAFVDGHNLHLMPLVQDHKRAYENDSGPNTGGMGSYSDRDHLLPFVSKEDVEASSSIMTDAVHALRRETGEEYHGILYGQFMPARSLDEEKPSPKLIEFNCRFGDPEAMNALALLSDETNFLEVCERIAEGTLKPKHFSFQEKATVCKYLVPTGYPENVTPAQTITVDEKALAQQGAEFYYASVDMKDGLVVTTSSRTLAIVGAAETINAAEQVAEGATGQVQGPLRHRRDIGTSGLIAKRIEHMRLLTMSPAVVAPVETGIV